MSFTDNFVTYERVRRDRWGRYLVLPPSGTKPIGYTRATTVAKALDDTSALMAWGERMTAIGLSLRPDLLAQIDPKADKKTLNALCQKAKEQGGATVRRDLGTYLHGMLEQSFNDPDYQAPAAHQADVAAVHQQLSAAGLEVVDGMTERMVVLDEYQIAGTFDLLVRDRYSGDLLIADIKTGSSVTYGSLGFCVQLSLYANADCLYIQGDAADGSLDDRTYMPVVNRERAVIIHVEPGSGVCQLHELRLDWSLAALALAVRASRARRDLLTTWTLPDDISSERDAWIRRRIERAVEANRELVKISWPGEIPPPKKIDAYSDLQVAVLDPIIARIEAELDLPFDDPDPRVVRAREAVTLTTGTSSTTTTDQPVMPDEGQDAPFWRDLLRDRFEHLDDDQRQWISQRVTEARDAGLAIRVADHPSERRCAIAQVLLEVVSQSVDDDRLRHLVATALNDDIALMPSMPLGAVLGLLNAEQAVHLAELLGTDPYTKENP